jgi:hypothetical protein
MRKRLQEVYFMAPFGDGETYVTLNGVVEKYTKGDNHAVIRTFHTGTMYQVPLVCIFTPQDVHLNTGLLKESAPPSARRACKRVVAL